MTERIRPTFKESLSLGIASLALAGCASAITINEDTVIYFDNPPKPEIVSHEDKHRKQIEEAGGMVIFWTNYLTSPEYRCQIELDAGASLTHPACVHVLYENQDKIVDR